MMDNPSKKRQLLESAKYNLRSLPFYAVMPYLHESQSLFEWTFGLKFKRDIEKQKNRHDRNSAEVLATLSPNLRQKIEIANDLDIELYRYALDLFQQRYRYLRQHKLTQPTR